MRTVRETSAGGLVVDGLDGPREHRSAALIGRTDRRGRLLWSLPKGHIEAGETSEQTAIREVDSGLIEAARAMGAAPFQIVRKVLIPEAMPGIILGLTLAVVSLIGYSAMVGAVGGGGLGDLGIRYGYQRFMPEVMLAVVVILILLVQAVQSCGEWIASRFDKRAPRNRGR